MIRGLLHRARRRLGAGRAGEVLRGVRGAARGVLFRLRHRGEPRWHCPVCGYRGPFADQPRAWGARRHATCPHCGALERHRLQYLALESVLGGVDTSRLACLHVAPEPFFRGYFSRRFGRYATTDLSGDHVDLNADLCALPFADGSFDVVFASHVLEHIPDDHAAIAEIWRVLRPGGRAILPVPLVGLTTVEYGAANPHDWGHWRAPARDYFDRYRARFGEVREIDSTSFAAEHQLFVHEDMTLWPTPEVPLRQSVPGERHLDVVPVCIR